MAEDSQKPSGATRPPQVSLMRGDRPAHIVLCDDEPYVREAIRLCLGMWFKDFETVESSDGDAAWRQITHHTPDLLISDCAHVGMRIQEMIYRLYRTSNFFPILVCSSSLSLACAREQLSGFTLFPVHLLDKPFTLDLLRSKVHEALGLPG